MLKSLDISANNIIFVPTLKNYQYVLKYGIFVVTGFVCPFLQTYIHIGKSPSKRFKMRMMQYFKHIEYADKILSLLLLFDVVYHISTNKRQRGGKRKAF